MLRQVEKGVTLNGEIEIVHETAPGRPEIHPPEAEPPAIDAGLAAAALAVFAHRHEVVHLLYAATDEPDALARIANLLKVDESTIGRVLDQPLRWMLPQFRAELETISATPG
jgi:hypothetical protein